MESFVHLQLRKSQEDRSHSPSAEQAAGNPRAHAADVWRDQPAYHPSQQPYAARPADDYAARQSIRGNQQVCEAPQHPSQGYRPEDSHEPYARGRQYQHEQQGRVSGQQGSRLQDEQDPSGWRPPAGPQSGMQQEQQRWHPREGEHYREAHEKAGHPADERLAGQGEAVQYGGQAAGRHRVPVCIHP